MQSLTRRQFAPRTKANCAMFRPRKSNPYLAARDSGVLSRRDLKHSNLGIND
jgi:hypothetical protein